MLTFVMMLVLPAFADPPRPAPVQPRHAAPAARPAPPSRHALPARPPPPGPRYYYATPPGGGYYAPPVYGYYPRYYSRGWYGPGYQYPGPPVAAPVVAGPPPIANRPPPPPPPAKSKRLDRAKSLAVGIRGGSLFGGYEAGEMFVDPGIGLAVRWRPESAVGLEVSGTRFDPTAFLADSPRVHALYDGSVEYFFFSHSKVSPYVLGGATYTLRNFDDEHRQEGRTETLTARDANWGPHAGAGIELSLGKSVAVDFEARYTALMTTPIEDPTFPGVVTANAAVMLHF